MLKLLLILAAATAIAASAHSAPLEFQDLSDADADVLLADVANELHSKEGLDLNDEFFDLADDPQTDTKIIDAPDSDIKSTEVDQFGAAAAVNQKDPPATEREQIDDAETETDASETDKRKVRIYIKINETPERDVKPTDEATEREKNDDAKTETGASETDVKPADAPDTESAERDATPTDEATEREKNDDAKTETGASETDMKPADAPETDPATENPEPDIKPNDETAQESDEEAPECDLGTYKQETGSDCVSCPADKPATAYGIVGASVCLSCGSGYIFDMNNSVCLNIPEIEQMDAQEEVVDIAVQHRAEEIESARKEGVWYIEFPQEVSNGRWKHLGLQVKTSKVQDKKISKVPPCKGCAVARSPWSPRGPNAQKVARVFLNAAGIMVNAVKDVSGNVIAFAGHVGQVVKDVAGHVVRGVQQAHQFIQDIAGNAVKLVKDAAGHVVAVAKDIAGHIGRGVQKFARSVKKAAQKAVRVVKKVAKHIGRGVKKVVEHIGRGIRKVHQVAKDAAGHVIRAAGQAVRHVGLAVSHASKFVKSAAKKVASGVRNASTHLRRAAGHAVAHVRGAVHHAAKHVGNTLRSVGNSIKNVAHKTVNKVRNVVGKIGGFFRRKKAGKYLLQAPRKAAEKVYAKLRKSIGKSMKKLNRKISNHLRRFGGFFLQSIEHTAGRHVSRSFQRRISKDVNSNVNKIMRTFRGRIDRHVNNFFGKLKKNLRRPVISIRAFQDTQSEDMTLQMKSCAVGKTCCLQGWYGEHPNCIQCPSSAPSSPRTASGGPDSNCNCPNAAASSCFACSNVCRPFNVATGICTPICSTCKVVTIGGLKKPSNC